MAPSDSTPDSSLRRALVQRLESLARAGVTHIPRRAASPLDNAKAPIDEQRRDEPPPADGSIPSRSRRRVSAADLFAAEQPAPSSVAPQNRPAALEIIQREVAACTRCADLAATRTQTVFGVGNPQARLCFVGEAPGADEDAQGEPFVGRAGQLLTKIIEACTLRREDVYICNVLKCRPPDNRTPLPDETSHCRGYLERQLEIVQPEFICCLGLVAAQTLLETTSSIGRLRGRLHDYQGTPVLVTYHPAYLLRNPNAKKDVWEDMKMLMGEMGIAVPH